MEDRRIVAGEAGEQAAGRPGLAEGVRGLIGRAVSGWPAFALLVALKLLFGLLDPEGRFDDLIRTETIITTRP